MSTSNKGIKWGHKNHLWRDAVLPTDGPSKEQFKLYCFVTFLVLLTRSLYILS